MVSALPEYQDSKELKRLHPFVTKRRYLYRGIEPQHFEEAHYEVGVRRFFPAFTSASTKLKVATSFAGKGGVVFLIRVAQNKPFHNLFI